MAEAALSSSAMRALSARSYEKRKNGALEIETVVRGILNDAALTLEAKTESVKGVVRKLANEFIVSKSSHSRKGGLIGLAAVALGCSTQRVSPFLDMLLPPVLRCFDDPEARVRYYACEALFNVCKVGRGSLLLVSDDDVVSLFASVFDGLCKLCADPDSDVKNGSMLLDRLLKEIVLESSQFKVDRFVDEMILKYLRLENPYVRQLILGWIATLNSLPDVDFIARLPLVLDGLFEMLEDANAEIREAATHVLGQFLSQLKTSEEKRIHKPDLVSMVDVLASRSRCENVLVRKTALRWISEFIDIDSSVLVKTHIILGSLLHCIGGSSDEESSALAKDINDRLCTQVSTYAEDINESPLVDLFISSVEKERHSVVRSSSLAWITMLLDKIPSQMLAPKNRTRLLRALLSTLHNSQDNAEVTLNALEALARMADDHDAPVLLDVLDLFESDRELMERRGGLVLRRLSVLLTPARIFNEAAQIITLRADAWPSAFTASLVRLLNVLLITSMEAAPLRADLRTNTKSFDVLFKAFSHSAVSVLSLCLIAGEFELAGNVISSCVETEVDVEFLVGLDRTVQLLESPVFLNVRLALLKTGRDFQPHLLKALYGVLMLLPQATDAFKVLDARLRAATSMHAALGASATTITSEPADERKRKLLDVFRAQREVVFVERSAELLSESIL